MKKAFMFLSLIFLSQAFAQMDLSSPEMTSVTVGFISDPLGAEVYVSNTFVGRTPVSVKINFNTPTSYRVLIPDPAYLPYEGSVSASRDETVSVYVPRASFTTTPVQPVSEAASSTTLQAIGNQENPVGDYVDITFTSDPSGASIFVDYVNMGRTPLTLTLKRGIPIYYEVFAAEPYPNIDLYKPYSTSFTPQNNDNISIWIDRTTAAEQALQQISVHSPNSVSFGFPQSTSTISEMSVLRACCKYCSKGKPCGNSCIARYKTCHVGPGCAC